MSYDLMVFDPASVPRERQEFTRWYSEQTQWSEDHGYENSAVTTAALRAWYDAMRSDFFPMNGQDSPTATDLPNDSPLWDDDRVTGYTIGREFIYCDFRWSKAEVAREAVVRLAEKHKVGFFDVSASEGLIAFPGDEYI